MKTPPIILNFFCLCALLNKFNQATTMISFIRSSLFRNPSRIVSGSLHHTKKSHLLPFFGLNANSRWFAANNCFKYCILTAQIMTLSGKGTERYQSEYTLTQNWRVCKALAEGSLVNKRDLQALYLSRTYSHKTGTRPPS